MKYGNSKFLGFVLISLFAYPVAGFAGTDDSPSKEKETAAAASSSTTKASDGASIEIGSSSSSPKQIEDDSEAFEQACISCGINPLELRLAAAEKTRRMDEKGSKYSFGPALDKVYRAVCE